MKRSNVATIVPVTTCTSTAATMPTQCDAALLGRESVDGAVHATSLASIVRGLAGGKTRSSRQGRRYLLRCSDAGVELLARRTTLQRSGRLDDEGFESDDDRRSTRSDDSNSNSVSSSCCLVDDHVFKAAQPAAPATTSSTSSDSANSSGGSDTDEVDTSAVGPKSLEVAVETSSVASSTATPIREAFSFQDVAFFHVDAAFPRVVVLVVRRAAAPRRLRVGREPPAGGLEALVLECRSEESLRALCSSYQELSRRMRLDGQYRAPHRRKDAPTSSSDDVKESAISKVSSAAPPVGTLPKFIFSKVDEVDRSSGPASIASTTRESDSGSAVSRFNLVHRTDGDGVTHIEVSRGAGGGADDIHDMLNDEDHIDKFGPSSIISISTPDSGNILQHSSSAAKDRSRISKEIEGVIRADVETGLNRREAGFRQRQQPDVLETKLWTTALAPREDSLVDPPQRPERKRFVRKNKAPAPPAPAPESTTAALKKKTQEALHNTLNRQTAKNSAAGLELKARGAEQRVVRGQFIRVSVDQQQQQPSSWVNHFPAGWTGPPPARSVTPHPVAPTWRREMYQDTERHRYQRRSRSSESGRGHPRTRSPPRRPMAYRYIDTPAVAPRVHTSSTTNSLSNRFFGLSQKLREIGGSVVGTGYPGGRRNSWGDSPTRFYTSLDPPVGKATGTSAMSNNLKSVIKKNHGGSEPKKVTFSAYATVQVVD